ncbi:alkaline phosphatase family protein [Ornithinimicrobium sp. W1679]|uniref:alkaline phosphatase family protein n=1 Tax=unclassified Ornithinimicrobium TaxID=2615080 RepID=UPI003CEF23B2
MSTPGTAPAPRPAAVDAARALYRPPAPGEGLASVLPAALVALGVDLPSGTPVPTWSLPAARHVVVVLVDGLGSRQLARRSGHAPFLRSMTPADRDARCGFPSTTATSLTSLGTGLPPGGHGIVGWQTVLPDGRLFNHLGWRDGPDPLEHQPAPTLLQHAEDAGVSVTTVSRPLFENSGFTRVALRGGGYVGTEDPGERAAGVLGALAGAGRSGRSLVYAYWDEVDKAGHVHGPGSMEWGEALEGVDAFVRELAAGAPRGTVVVLTSDHGMVDAPHEHRRDLADDAVLAAGVRVLAGEPRAPQAWCEPGAVGQVVATWTRELGDSALVLTRQEAVEAGWFGPVRPGYEERVGEVVAAMLDATTVLDSRLLRPQVLALRGHHGSVTDAETAVPLLVHEV